MHRAPRLLALLLSLLAAPFAVAESLPPGMTMHRVQAGAPDASGWMTAASTGGGFSVRLPIRFNDFTVVDLTGSAPTLRTDTVGGKSAEGLKFSATRIVYRRGAAGAREYFAQFASGAAFVPRPERLTPLAVGGRPAVDLVVRHPGTVAHQRAVRLEKDVLLLVLEAPAGEEALARKLAGPFFESLAVTAP